jgi:hypothetical protein
LSFTLAIYKFFVVDIRCIVLLVFRQHQSPVMLRSLLTPPSQELSVASNEPVNYLGEYSQPTKKQNNAECEATH